MKFEIVHSDKGSSARAGVLHTPHGEVHTPIFMPVGTVGSVKAVHAWEQRKNFKPELLEKKVAHLINKVLPKYDVETTCLTLEDM